ncbi:hypothetical protein N9W34_05615, partial [Rickettsiales bacterium]|nr:hypothetical protein [Rickettsiales bacterium]
SLDVVIDTVKNPSDLATGDAVVSLIKKLLKNNSQLETQEVVSMLEESGLYGADRMKDFIRAQLELQKSKDFAN